MDKDIIVEEIRKIRETHAAKFDYQLHAICEDLREKEKICGHPLVSFPPKHYTPNYPKRRSGRKLYEGN